MTTTDTKNEYVTDVEHSPDCRSIGDRSALYLMRQISQTQAIYFDEDCIYGPEERHWELEETLEPLRLCCASCSAERYVAQDEHGDIVKLTPERCVRFSQAYGHFTSYGNKLCEYCGYVRGAKQ